MPSTHSSYSEALHCQQSQSPSQTDEALSLQPGLLIRIAPVAAAPARARLQATMLRTRRGYRP